MGPTAVPDAMAAYESWAASRMASRTDPLTQASAGKYRAIWRSWCTFLAPRCPWHLASATDLREFLAGIAARGHVQKSAHVASSVTMRRYWRVVSRVYIHAADQGWVAFNPGAEISLDVPRNEHSVAAVLRPMELSRLRADLARAAAGPDLTWQQVRDHALLAVLLDVAPTTAELCALRDDQVLDHSPTGSFVLRLDGQRPAQKRDLLLAPATAQLLRRWRALRLDLYPERASRPEVLFTSRKQPGRLTPSGVFTLLRGLIADIEREHEQPVAHRGANVVRSSVIVEWLRQGQAVSDILARAGLDTPRALHRLQGVAETVRLG